METGYKEVQPTKKNNVRNYGKVIESSYTGRGLSSKSNSNGNKEYIVKKIVLLSGLFGLGLLTSCSSIVNGSHQSVSVLTPPVQNARCALENTKGKWYLNRTPGSIVIHRSHTDLIVTCEKAGFDKASTRIPSKPTGAVFGNILLGGIPGILIDSINGSAFEYPKEIKVPLAPSKKIRPGKKRVKR